MSSLLLKGDALLYIKENYIKEIWVAANQVLLMMADIFPVGRKLIIQYFADLAIMIYPKT